MEPELKTLLGALVEGQVRLAEGLERTNAAVTRLAEAQIRTEARVAELAEAQRETEKRMAWFAEQLMRSSTEAAQRHGVVMERLDKLEGP